MKEKQSCLHFILHPSAFILFLMPRPTENAGRALPSARPASVGTRNGAPAELRKPAGRRPPAIIFKTEDARDAGSNSGGA